MLQVRAFRGFCRKVVIMDGAHLKGDFKGTILHAVAMDGNNQILPLAYGICKSESGPSWTWFMQHLYECIGDIYGLTFVSDKAASIALAVGDVFPLAHHGVCAFHLLGNMVQKFGKNSKTKGLFWRLVRAFKPSEFEQVWERFSKIRPEEARFLLLTPREQWTRAYCPTIRYDYLTSNSAESMNAVSKHARKMPILPLLEFFRALMQKWFYNRAKAASKT